jgi:hypothetical protein
MLVKIIELQRRNEHVVYVDSGRVITVMSIYKIQFDYGDNSPDQGILEKLKEKGRAWPFYITTKKMKP